MWILTICTGPTYFYEWCPEDRCSIPGSLDKKANTKYSLSAKSIQSPVHKPYTATPGNSNHVRVKHTYTFSTMADDNIRKVKRSHASNRLNFRIQTESIFVYYEYLFYPKLTSVEYSCGLSGGTKFNERKDNIVPLSPTQWPPLTSRIDLCQRLTVLQNKIHLCSRFWL